MNKFFTVLLITFSSLSAFSQSGKEAEVWARVEALNKAIFEDKDSAAIEDLVSDAVTYGHSTGIIENQPAMVHTSVSSTDVYKNISQERQGTIQAGQTFIIRYILRADVVKDGNTTPLNIGILQVWARDKGKWRLFARQAVKVNPK